MLKGKPEVLPKQGSLPIVFEIAEDNSFVSGNNMNHGWFEGSSR
ncbi:hypothetical protein [Chryseobacterium vrystaatense]|nr:hypothetical protein [Chryseobacterium vrystaatense]